MEAELADELRDPDHDNHLDRLLTPPEAARAHALKGERDQATAIWRELAAEGGSAGNDAAADYIDHVLRHWYGDVEWSALENTKAKIGESVLTVMWTGLLLERQGMLTEALAVYSEVIDQMTQAEVKSSRWAVLMATGRRRVKWAMGLELSGLDLLGEAGEVEAVDKYFNLLDLLRQPRIAHGWVVAWSRDELIMAREQWPRRVTAASVEAYYQQFESALRSCDERVMIELWTFGTFGKCVEAAEQLLAVSAAGEPTHGATRRDRVGVAWPPGRNQPCWCGSERKYKRCCGTGRPQESREAWGPAGLRAGAEVAVGRV
ncbi:SEC-C domain-containing protein [Kribbella sp. NPDC059898]|uniref:SEC-C domain-containing protein n=1 Tax=Kribbella sp. NPDC059898 TaxID=3346995 RepID=UPI003654B81B